MEKERFKVKCVNIQQTTDRASVQFAAGIQIVQPEIPGQPARQGAKDVFTFNFSDPKAVTKYEINKEYTFILED